MEEAKVKRPSVRHTLAQVLTLRLNKNTCDNISSQDRSHVRPAVGANLGVVLRVGQIEIRTCGRKSMAPKSK
jgi:hypothetical protein